MKLSDAMGEKVIFHVQDYDDKSDFNEIWDDSELITAFEKAQQEISDRVLNGTTTNKTSNSSDTSKFTRKVSDPKKSEKTKWKVGEHCRAVYSDDGLEYEAIVVKINKSKCVIRFVGYGNEQEVAIVDLKPSAGSQAICDQDLAAIETANRPEEFEEQSHEANVYTGHEERFNRAEITDWYQRDRSSLDSIPPPPMPPMPPHIAQMPYQTEAEHEAFQAMLQSWYLSGYHTGYYLGVGKRSNCGNCNH